MRQRSSPLRSTCEVRGRRAVHIPPQNCTPLFLLATSLLLPKSKKLPSVEIDRKLLHRGIPLAFPDKPDRKCYRCYARRVIVAMNRHCSRVQRLDRSNLQAAFSTVNSLFRREKRAQTRGESVSCEGNDRVGTSAIHSFVHSFIHLAKATVSSVLLPMYYVTASNLLNNLSENIPSGQIEEITVIA